MSVNGPTRGKPGRPPGTTLSTINGSNGIDSIRMRRKRAAFLECLAKGLSVSAACEAAELARSVAYKWRVDHKDFCEEWNQALDTGVDVLEDEALRRAKDGIEKAVYHRGEVVGSVREYSDVLMIFLLKAKRPDKYRERTVNMHEHAGRLEVADASESRATLEQKLSRNPQAVDAAIVEGSPTAGGKLN